ncbi:MAG: hypothetical protein Kow0010_08880 [Dehalococcoidia bacterium]
MGVVSRIATVCFIVALPVLLVTTNIRFLAGEVRFYERGFRSHGADEATGIALSELDRSARAVIDYFENDADTLRIVVLKDDEEVSLFNPRETAHMQDVKQLMRAVFRVHEISLAFVLTYVTATVLWSGERSPRRLAREAMAGVAAGVVAILAVGTFALAGFDQAWTRFHELVFPNDLWRLNPRTDHLIQMFPEAFWEEAVYIVGALTLVEATIIVVASTAYLLFARDHASPDVPARAPESAYEVVRQFEQAQPPPPQQPPGDS